MGLIVDNLIFRQFLMMKGLLLFISQFLTVRVCVRSDFFCLSTNFALNQFISLSTEMKQMGFEVERFQQGISETFICRICMLTACKPIECVECGAIFCEFCITNWFKKSPLCPFRCSTQKKMKKIQGALQRIYNNMKLKCINYQTCKKVVTIQDIEQHERQCLIPECRWFKICKKKINFKYQKQNVCSKTCLLMSIMKDNQKNRNQLYLALLNFHSTPISKLSNELKIFWNKQTCGTGIQITNKFKSIFLKQVNYVFRSILALHPFNQGIHYWEIIPNPNTENQIKIGICKNKQFDYNTAFCDYSFGYAFYGMGQLRHNSSCLGNQYGKKFKKEGILGVCLNMIQGSLSFSLNDEFLGVAFSLDDLKKGPIYPAISLLHCSGCTITDQKPVPNIFK